MRFLALAAIRFYQRHLSPLKGFACAYRVHTGRASCSALGYRVIRRFGILPGVVLLKERTRRCGIAHRRFSLTPAVLAMRAERGFCDCAVPCDIPACDIPSCDIPSCDIPTCDIPSCDLPSSNIGCCDCSGCDWPGRRKKADEDEKDVHIPSKTSRPAQPGED